ncbi:hypothetical protein B484DRAFT_400040 [Ochromonadaceae sp. CCMP2298]|nr:hypothetical protein B484DRAFT_400040 [Ochromonadaceae sp. CCMP2298]
MSQPILAGGIRDMDTALATKRSRKAPTAPCLSSDIKGTTPADPEAGVGSDCDTVLEQDEEDGAAKDYTGWWGDSLDGNSEDYEDGKRTRPASSAPTAVASAETKKWRWDPSSVSGREAGAQVESFKTIRLHHAQQHKARMGLERSEDAGVVAEAMAERAPLQVYGSVVGEARFRRKCAGQHYDPHEDPNEDFHFHADRGNPLSRDTAAGPRRLRLQHLMHERTVSLRRTLYRPSIAHHPACISQASLRAGRRSALSVMALAQVNL